MKFDYYYGSQAEQFSFVRIPRIMLTDKSFQELSIAAKVLYGVLLDRMSLSMKNGWFDEDNRVYIIYQIGEIMEDLGFTKKKAMDLLTELETFGLLEKKRRGHGLPNILFVKSFMTEIESRGSKTSTSGKDTASERPAGSEDRDSETIITEPMETGEKCCQKQRGQLEKDRSDQFSKEKSCFDDMIRERKIARDYSRGSENGTSDRSGQQSRSAGFGTQEVSKPEPLEVQESAPLKNQTNNNYTYRNQTDSNRILSAGRLMRYDEMRSEEAARKAKAYEELIRENIDYDSLLISHSHDREMIDGIVDLILETVLSSQDYILIASNQYPAGVVKSKFLKLNYSHIECVLECLRRSTTKVANIRKYLLAVLFNAPSTMDGYYQAAVQHDMPQLALHGRG